METIQNFNDHGLLLRKPRPQIKLSPAVQTRSSRAHAGLFRIIKFGAGVSPKLDVSHTGLNPDCPKLSRIVYAIEARFPLCLATLVSENIHIAARLLNLGAPKIP